MRDAVERRGEHWVIVTSEADLSAALPVSALSAADGEETPEDRIAARGNQCLEGVRSTVRRNHPVAVLSSQTHEMLGVRFPVVGRVSRDWKDEQQNHHFSVDGSPVVFTLPAEQRRLSAIVSEASESGTGLLVLDPLFDGRPALVRPWADLEPIGFCDRFDLDPSTISALTRMQACASYEKVFAQNAVPPYEEGIPFRLSYAYCEQKAEAVAGLLRDDHIDVGKVWIFAKQRDVLRIRTTSRRSCREQWAFHVAVVVRSQNDEDGGFWVFDPTISLESGVLSFQEWTARFGSSRGQVHFTRSDAYTLNGSCFKTVLSQGEVPEALKVARCQLRSFVEVERGHPPFPCGSAPVQHP